MKTTNTLTNIVLAGTLALGAIGCKDYQRHPEYHFNGKIGGEIVVFHEKGVSDNLGHDVIGNVLTVYTKGGNRVSYLDFNDDFMVDRIEITTYALNIGSNRTKYKKDSKNPAVQEIIGIGQIKFDEYLKSITDHQTAPLFNANLTPESTPK